MVSRLVASLSLAAACAPLLAACTTIHALTRTPIALPPPPLARAALQPVTAIIIDPPNWGPLPATRPRWARPWSPAATCSSG